MIVKSLYLRDFRGYPEASIEFRPDFTCLIGPNGIGKTTALEAISLLCSSLDFKDDKPSDATDEEWVPRITGQQRLEAYLRRNIRLYGEPGGAKGFHLEGVFEHGGREYRVGLSEKGFALNDVVGQDWWWPGIVYFARFDTEMNSFQLRPGLWPRFKRHYEGITGFEVEPEEMVETELERLGMDGRVITGFYLDKGPRGRIHSRRCSAGEKKIAKALAQVVNLERKPHIALVDNLEMHVHYKRHLRMVEEIRKMFAGMQVVSTTHSTVIMDEFGGQDGVVVDVEEVLHGEVSED